MIHRKVIICLFLCLLIGCSQSDDQDMTDSNLPRVTFDEQIVVMEQAYDVLSAIQNRKMTDLAEFVHPKKGLLFSPYGTVDNKRSQVFMPAQVKDLLTNKKQLEWGTEAGKGEPIRLAPEDYFKTYVYDVEFIETDFVTYNGYYRETNSIQNITEAFPESNYIEFFVPGSEEYEGMDWKSLKLVFTNYEGEPYLAGIVHDQWTP
ncbi:hypothetical protein JI666_16430 [Bacillus sp. NTK071]|uniref:hypothetical protein n=1 Tax=Bacillus sp. NTK071 TaxID=2802175 RepID=UPI001A8C8ABD|nr:hypothetical protein [Bacillus sp. NTK071]MBN8210341.1 hypothetical protein [Bacillus sp. NTK071]